jgi:hypothetical protein
MSHGFVNLALYLYASCPLSVFTNYLDTRTKSSFAMQFHSIDLINQTIPLNIAFTYTYVKTQLV